MKKRTSFIAILSLVLFALPTIFQPVHLIWHIRPMQTGHQDCSLECLPSAPATTSPVSTLDVEKGYCLICNFDQIQLQELAVAFYNIEKPVSPFSSVFTIESIYHPYFSGISISLRAPPLA